MKGNAGRRFAYGSHPACEAARRRARRKPWSAEEMAQSVLIEVLKRMTRGDRPHHRSHGERPKKRLRLEHCSAQCHERAKRRRESKPWRRLRIDVRVSLNRQASTTHLVHTVTVTRRKAAGMDVAPRTELLFSFSNNASSSFCKSAARPFFSAASKAFIVGP